MEAGHETLDPSQRYDGRRQTTVCRQLKQRLPHCVFLDGDWCWDMEPFVVTEETKAMVLRNITYLLSQFLACTAYENIIFCWVMHEESILRELLSRLSLSGCRVWMFSLVCSEEALRHRLQKDIDAGLRRPDILLAKPLPVTLLPRYGYCKN